MENGGVKDVIFCLPQLLSFYRKNEMSRDAIKAYEYYYQIYGEQILSVPLITSIAAAYCDMDEYIRAEICLNNSIVRKADEKQKEYIENLRKRIRAHHHIMPPEENR